MRKRERQEKILGSTLSESLILFLFILLAIASIYRKTIAEQGIIPPGHKIVPNDSEIIRAGWVSVREDQFNDFEKNISTINELNRSNSAKDDLIDNLKKKIQNNNKQHNSKLNRVTKKLREQIEKTDIVEKLGVGAPACTLKNGDMFILFDIDFLSDTTYLLTFRNIPTRIQLKKQNKHYNKLENIYVKTGDKVRLSHDDFKRFGRQMINSKKINKQDAACYDGSPSNKQSAYCLECQYVYHVRYDQKKTRSIFKKKVSKELALFMNNTVNLYFFSSMIL